jgi:putative ABC transport system permease protein
MFIHYLRLALSSFRRNPVLTALMVLAIALGIGACMTTLTVFHVLSGDPLPGRSAMLFHPQLEPRDKAAYIPGDEPPQQLTRLDAETLLREARADRQAMMTGGLVSITPARPDIAPQFRAARYTTADMFAMFNMPLLFGRSWNKVDDEAHARVAVISRELNQRLFAGENSVGRTLRIEQADFDIIGVLNDWRPMPRFYDVNSSPPYGGRAEDVFLPFAAAMDAKMSLNGDMSCWAASSVENTALNAPCVWIQYWVQLDSPQKQAAYFQYLRDYSEQQRAVGRFERPTNAKLRDARQWLVFLRLFPDDVRIQMWLAMGFLLACLFNTLGLLLAKFLRRSGEIGVRRALGATRGAIFRQLLVESGTIGFAGGLCGLGLALLGLWIVRQQPVSYADLARLDPAMLLLTFALAIVCSLLAGALPAWRAMQTVPAMQLKAQ